MANPRIIIADTDSNYIIPLQAKFAEEFPVETDLEIITDREYFERLFEVPQKADILIVSDQLYSGKLGRHEIGQIFVMMEKMEEGKTDELSLNRIFKYSSIREIFNEIMGKSADIININTHIKKSCQIILVTSAAGGVGKTTVAMGLAGYLARSYKKVLYIDAEHMQSFHGMLENRSPIMAPDIYMKLGRSGSGIYQEIRHVIRKEIFSYLPPFKGPLMSLGLHFSVYRQLVEDARRVNDYDFIIVDTDSVYDEEKAELMGTADRVVIVTGQTERSVQATDILVSGINGIGSEKYLFICNDFKKEAENFLTATETSLRFRINEYIEHIPEGKRITADVLTRDSGIQKTAFLLM